MTDGGADYCFECIGLASLMEEAFNSSRDVVLSLLNLDYSNMHAHTHIKFKSLIYSLISLTLDYWIDENRVGGKR